LLNQVHTFKERKTTSSFLRIDKCILSIPGGTRSKLAQTAFARVDRGLLRRERFKCIAVDYDLPALVSSARAEKNEILLNIDKQ